MGNARERILTINGGSSSVKFALFDGADPPRKVLSGKVERVGQGGGAKLTAHSAEGDDKEERDVEAPDHEAALKLILDWVGGRADLEEIGAIGHRVVHGGPTYFEPTEITDEVLDGLRKISPFDPDHLPAELSMIEAARRDLPARPQFACFDTAFHRDMPRVAQLLPIPRRYEEAGARRYGFHGLSFEFLMKELARVAGDGAAQGRVILAHLGSGASLAAVREGRSVDTTMGLTPAAGLVMGTRTGDIDPGLPAYLARAEGMTAERFDHLINQESGLLGVSGRSADLRDLTAIEATDAHAAEAVDLFCHSARKWIGAMAAVLGGLETLVFSGGIGEHSSAIRGRICAGLEFLGVTLDDARNRDSAAVISAEGAAVTVRVIPTDEELTVARAVRRLLGPGTDR